MVERREPPWRHWEEFRGYDEFFPLEAFSPSLSMQFFYWWCHYLPLLPYPASSALERPLPLNSLTDPVVNNGSRLVFQCHSSVTVRWNFSLDLPGEVRDPWPVQDSLDRDRKGHVTDPPVAFRCLLAAGRMICPFHANSTSNGKQMFSGMTLLHTAETIHPFNCIDPTFYSSAHPREQQRTWGCHSACCKKNVFCLQSETFVHVSWNCQRFYRHPWRSSISKSIFVPPGLIHHAHART